MQLKRAPQLTYTIKINTQTKKILSTSVLQIFLEASSVFSYYE